MTLLNENVFYHDKTTAQTAGTTTHFLEPFC